MVTTCWTIGVDPGFKETGLVLRRGNKEVEAWSTFQCRPNGSAYMRTTALAFAVTDRMMDWVRDYKITHLDVAIETPIYNSNPRSFELQWRLVQDIEANIVLLDVQELWLTEVGPTTSKHLATGDGSAKKHTIFAHSPFRTMRPSLLIPSLVEEVFEAKTLTPAETHTLYSLSDAWAHSLAAWRGCKDCTRVRLTNYSNNLPNVKEICDGKYLDTE